MDDRKRNGIGSSGEEKKSSKELLGLRLTERDFEVLRFTLEMKFSSLESFYNRFFKFDGAKGSLWYTRERVALLIRHGYLSAIRVHLESKRYYLTTSKAVQALRNQFPDTLFPPALDSIDTRSFDHDKRVAECRIVLENSGRARNWRSERTLKHLKTRGSLAIENRDLIPDGIYLNKRDEAVAFELELAAKTKDRYAKKVNEYAIMMAVATAPFRRALFVVSTEFQLSTFRALAAPYGDQFHVISYAELLGVNHE